MDMDAEIRKVLGLGSTNSNRKSYLSDTLIQMWAWGDISAATLQRIALAACRDGLIHERVDQLSKLGSSGMYMGNCRRDLLNIFKKIDTVPAVVEIPLPILESRLEIESATSVLFPVLSPLDMFESLLKHRKSQIREMLGTGLETFWVSYDMSDRRMWNHPLLDRADYRTKAIPIVIHGDGARFNSRGNSLMVLSWSLLTAESGIWDNIFMFAAVPKYIRCIQSRHGSDTMLELWRWLAFFMNAMFDGRHPERDLNDCEWPRKSIQRKRAGMALSGGYYFVVLAITGDLEFVANELGLESFGSATPCWRCPIGHEARFNMRDVGPKAPWREHEYHPRDFTDAPSSCPGRSKAYPDFLLWLIGCTRSTSA